MRYKPNSVRRMLVGRVCPQAGVAGTKGARLCRPRPAAAGSASRGHLNQPHTLLSDVLRLVEDDTAALLWFRLRRPGDRRALPLPVEPILVTEQYGLHPTQPSLQ